MIGIVSRIRWLLCFVVMLAPGLSLAGTILVLGDSISAGYGLENLERGWVGLLQQRLQQTHADWSIVNASISGDTSAGGLARVDDLLQRHAPGVVILELGGNDGLRGLPPARLKENLTGIIARCRAAGAKVLLVGMRIPPNYGRRYTELFEGVFPQVAAEQKADFVPFLLDGVGGNRSLMQGDGLHPNGEAQPVMMDLVWQKLVPLLKAPK
ncbi:arylesterase [Methyloterricola oryzae]|uniref:arylesterase n=1 Tax=Methyloterricola oryzae TaxID=1495050 RepID=UPI0009E253F6|nr:arylesterase [Methyloterricola oryzae]